MSIPREMIEKAKEDAKADADYHREIFVVSLLNQLLSGRPHSSASVPREEHSQPAVQKRLSIKEFLLQKKPKSDVDKTLLIGQFLEKHEGFVCFNVDDVKEGYVKSKESLPENINHTINLNIRKGYITEYPEKKDNKKAFHITTTGEQTIEGWPQ